MDLNRAPSSRRTALAGASLLPAAVVDAEGTVREWTPGAEQILGYRADEVLGKPFADLCSGLTPDDMAGQLLRGPLISLPALLHHKEGNPVRTEILSTALPGTGAPLRLLVLTEAAYEENIGDTLKQWALDQLPFVASISDAKLRYVHANRLGARALNVPPDQILGKNLKDVLGTAVSHEVFDDMRQAIETGETRTMEVYDRLPHEARGHAWGIYNTPLKDPAGQVHGLYTVGVDITREYEARQRLILVNRASGVIGSTLDVSRTAEELVQVLVPELADTVSVDLLDSLFGDDVPSRGEGPWCCGALPGEGCRASRTWVRGRAGPKPIQPGPPTPTRWPRARRTSARSTAPPGSRTGWRPAIGGRRRIGPTRTTRSWWCRCGPGAPHSVWPATTGGRTP